MATALKQTGINFKFVLGNAPQNMRRVNTGLKKVNQGLTAVTKSAAKFNQQITKAFAGQAQKAAQSALLAYRQELSKNRAVMEAYITTGEDYREIAAVMGMSTQQLAEYMQQLGFTSQQITTFFQGNKAAMQDLDAATQQLNKSTLAIIKRFATMAIGSGSVYFALLRLRREIIRAVKETYEGTEEYERYTEALQDTKKAFTILATGGSDWLELLDESAGLILKVRDYLLYLNAAYKASDAVQEELIGGNLRLAEAFNATTASGIPLGHQIEKMSTDIYVWLQSLGLFPRAADLAQTRQAALNEELAKTDEILADNEDEAKKYENAIRAMIDALDQASEAAREHAEAMREIRQTYRDEVLDIQKDYYEQRADIEASLSKKISDINRDAQRSRERVIKSYERNIQRQTRQAHRQVEQMQEAHHLRMEFARRRHQLSMAQNERIYQYNRRRLVAEGDVLAIEDLDARYELEKQAAQENFQLQQQQAQALFEMQLRYQRQAAREQAQLLQQTLREQLREIEESRRERIADAEEEAEEDLAIANKEAQDKLAIAKAEKFEAEQLEKEHNSRIEEENARHLGEILHDHDFTAAEVEKIARRVYGADGYLVSQTMAGYARIRQLTAELSKFIRTSLDLAYSGGGIKVRPFGGGAPKRGGTGRGGGTRSGLYGEVPSMYDYYNELGIPTYGGARQYGGTQVFSQPSLIEVGERGAEIVSVQPLSPIGSSMEHTFGGNINVTGRGDLSGVDLGVFANELVIAMAREQIKLQSRVRGQRGR